MPCPLVLDTDMQVLVVTCFGGRQDAQTGVLISFYFSGFRKGCMFFGHTPGDE